MRKDDLIKIKYEIYEQGGCPNPIDELDIYYDSSKGVYKHKFVCDCGENLGCFCFDSIESAIEDVGTRMMCSDCYNREMIEESILEDSDVAKKIDDLKRTNMHKNMICDGVSWRDTAEKYDEVMACVKKTIEGFSKEDCNQIADEIGIECECDDFSGYGCGV